MTPSQKVALQYLHAQSDLAQRLRDTRKSLGASSMFRRRIYSLLAIARRHPRLFARLNHKGA